MDYIVFTIKNSQYALSLDQLERIIQVPAITDVAQNNEYYDGLIEYADSVIRVVNLRKIFSLPSYDEELLVVFKELKQQHTDWVESLQNSVEQNIPFTKTTNQHECNLGKWLDSFICYDEEVSRTLKVLNDWHKRLHQSAIGVLQSSEESTEKGMQVFKETVPLIYQNTMSQIDGFITQFDSVAASLQKLLIYQVGDEKVAIKVDSIEDIIHLEKESDIVPMEHDTHAAVHINGVIDHNGKLINYIGGFDFQGAAVDADQTLPG
jgi:purine-binding chemotaxis protein CheW